MHLESLSGTSRIAATVVTAALLSVTVACRLAAPSGANTAIVHTRSGAVRGSNQDNLTVFKGVPFAQPPLGVLRWQPPRDPLPWQGIRDAVRDSASCVQDPAGLDPFLSNLAAHYGVQFPPNAPVATSEDCLYLNIWAPRPTPHKPLPVMVWIHGGSNLKGSGTQTMYDGAALTSKGVL